jgi:hypothetical protein
LHEDAADSGTLGSQSGSEEGEGSASEPYEEDFEPESQGESEGESEGEEEGQGQEEKQEEDGNAGSEGELEGEEGEEEEGETGSTAAGTEGDGEDTDGSDLLSLSEQWGGLDTTPAFKQSMDMLSDAWLQRLESGPPQQQQQQPQARSAAVVAAFRPDSKSGSGYFQRLGFEQTAAWLELLAAKLWQMDDTDTDYVRRSGTVFLGF